MLVTVLFAAFLVLHGAIHLLGVAKAYRLAELPTLSQPVTPAMGALWLLAAVLFVGSAVMVFLWPRWWWAVAGVAIVVSMVAILPSWVDAKAGAIANVVVLIGMGFGVLTYGPLSLRAEYDRDVDQALANGTAGPVVTDADLVTFPEPLQRYLRRVGVVGQTRVRTVRARMHGRIRSSPEATWMPFTAEQYNISRPAERLFYMTASLHGLPLQGYHRYVGDAASMRIKAAALVPVIDAAGPEMTAGETVTLLNDLCVLAPPMLLDAAIQWETIDARTVRATYSNARHTVHAVLSFNQDGDLMNFQSDDRFQASADGTSMQRRRWSTPIAEYRQFGAYHLLGRGEARWHEPAGDYAYIEMTVDDVAFDVTSR